MSFPLLFEAAVPSLVRYEVVVRPMKPPQPTSMGITWQAHPLSSHSMRSFSYWSFFLSKASSMFSSHGTVSSTMMTRLTVSDHITMSGRSWVCTMWCGKWRASFRSAAIFQSLAAARNFCPCGLLTCRVGASPSWRKLMHGFGSWVGCSLATLHWVSVMSASMASTLFRILKAWVSTDRYYIELPHLPLDKMAAIWQTIFSNAFLWMKKYEYGLKCHWSLFLRVQLTIFQHWFR